MMNPQELPPQAQTLLAEIEQHLDEAFATVASTAGEDADMFALRETQRRYLPDTLRTFFAVPRSLRSVTDDNGESPETQLIASLTTLELATRTHLRQAATSRCAATATNRDFLEERFAGLPASAETLPGSESPMQPSALFMRSLFKDTLTAKAGDAFETLRLIAARCEQAFPELTTVQRRLFSRDVKEVKIDVPVKNGILRYLLISTRKGVQASIAKVVGGVSLKTEAVPTDMWMEALLAHLAEFANDHRDTQQHLRELVRKSDLF